MVRPFCSVGSSQRDDIAMSLLFKKLSEGDELLELVVSLKQQVPCARFMGCIVEDIVDKKIEANVFVDQWPSFTTIVSQEFSPCVSEVADIRIYTTDKQNIEPLLTSAALLENTGTWQLIHFVSSEEDVEELSSHLRELFKSHESTKRKESSVVFDYKLYERDIKTIVRFGITKESVSEELFIKEVPKASAEFIAKHWTPAMLDYPLPYRVKYIEAVISKFGMMGVYSNRDERYPVSWCGRIPGREIGLSYTFKEFRHHGLNDYVGENTFHFLLKSGSFFIAVSSSSPYYESGYVRIGYRRSIAIY